MTILLVNPWITDFAAFDLWSRPLGLLYAGAFLRARGHDIRLVDCMDRWQDGAESGEERPFGTGKFRREIIPKPACFANIPRHYCRYGISTARFRELLREGPRPDAVLVTGVMTYWYPGAFEAIRITRETFPDAKIALGGIYATLCPEHARKHGGVDVVVTGSRPSEIVAAVETMTGTAGGGPVPEDAFARWPRPAWDMYGRLPAAVVMTSRGCPMRCTACASHLLCDSFERRKPEDAADEVLALADRGVRDIAFSDDALLLDSGRYAAPFFTALGDAGAPVRLHTPNGLHVREITPELAVLMRCAGVRTIRLSLETASDEDARERYSGKVSREYFRRAAAALRDAGFGAGDIGAYVLAGLPGQRPEAVYETVAFSHECGVVVRPALFSPVPGTPEFARAVESGRLRTSDDPLLHNNTLRTLDLWGGGDTYGRFRLMVTGGNARLGRA